MFLAASKLSAIVSKHAGALSSLQDLSFSLSAIYLCLTITTRDLRLWPLANSALQLSFCKRYPKQNSVLNLILKPNSSKIARCSSSSSDRTQQMSAYILFILLEFILILRLNSITQTIFLLRLRKRDRWAAFQCSVSNFVKREKTRKLFSTKLRSFHQGSLHVHFTRRGGAHEYSMANRHTPAFKHRRSVWVWDSKYRIRKTGVIGQKIILAKKKKKERCVVSVVTVKKNRLESLPSAKKE